MNNFQIPKQSYFIVSNYLKMQKKLPKVYMNIDINQKKQGRLVFELFENINPKTTENFKVLAEEKQYKDSTFNQIVPGLMIKGGQIKKTGNASIYGKKFPDESYNISHSKPGILSMVNNGPNSNGSEIFITLQAAQWLDQQNVAFGQLVEGFDVLAEIESLGNQDNFLENNNGNLGNQVKIVDCGQVDQK